MKLEYTDEIFVADITKHEVTIVFKGQTYVLRKGDRFVLTLSVS